ncbi:Wzy polymerase domain-containing protein [Cupriavidus pauculus]|uniref:PglL family O-oligosaccharyltransferase n=1 Tax=Cupriavidus pauculus TaxID=82633 RepID=UPI003857DAFC
MPAHRATIPATMIVVAFTLPLLVSKHTLPLATFYGEWTAAVLAVMLVVAMAFASGTAHARDRKGYPWVAWLPVWLIVTTILQAASGMVDITGSRLTTQLVLALGGVLMCMAWRMGQSMSTDQRAGVVDALAIAFLIAGLLGTLAQWVQVFHMEDQMFGLVSEYFYDTNRRLWGNLNQPNHQATVNGLALVAAVWLATRGWLRFPSWLVATLLLESGIVLTGSRTGLVHVGLAAVCALLAAWMARGTPRGASSPMHRAPGLVAAALILVIGVVALQPAIKMAGQAFDWRLFDTVQQLKSANQISYRSALWAQALSMFRAHPLFGVGYGEFGWGQFQEAAHVRVVAEMSLHAHNAVLDLLAKTGAVGTIGAAVVLLAWLWRVVRERVWLATPPERAMAVPMLAWLAMLGAHSMLEYPLHYLYLFLPFCFLLAWLEPSGFGRALPRPVLAALGVVFVATASAVLVTQWQDYRRVEAREYASDEHRDSLPMPRYWFRAHAESDAAEHVIITATNAASLLPAHVSALHLLPTPTLIRRSAWLLALTGESSRARLWMERLAFYYQGDESVQFNALVQDCDAMDAAHRPKDFCAWAKIRARHIHD